MAKASIGLPSNLYSGGAVTLDSTPFANYYLQTQQRKQAQEDALYKYFGDLGKNLTPAGMHSNDVGPLMEKQNAWRQYALEHKKEIARPSLDKGKAYQNYMGMYNDMQAHIAESKEKVKGLGTIASVYKDPAKKSLLTEKTLSDIEAGELPVTDPRYKRIDPTALNYNPKPFGLQEQGQLTSLLNRFKGSESLDGAPQKIPGTNQERIKYKTTFSPDQLKGVYNVGVTLYHNNPSFKQLVDQEADPLSNNYQPLNDVFKSHFGKDIQSPEDMATAHVLSLHPNRTGREVVRNVSTNPFDLIAARNASSKDLATFRQGLKNKNQEEIASGIDNMVNRQLEESKQHVREYTSSAGQKSKEYVISASPEIKKIFSYKDDKGHPVYPDEVRFSEDGKYVKPIFYTGNEVNGKKAVDTDNSKPILIEEYKTRLAKDLTGVKGAQKSLSTIPATSIPKPKSDPLKLF